MTPIEVRDSLLATVREVVRDRVAPRAAAIDREGVFPDDIRRLFAELGLLGLSVPEAYGGFGAEMELALDVIVEIAATCANSANILTQQALGIAPILYGGTEAQKQRWLPAFAGGESLASFALTEPDAGSDNRSMRTTFRAVDGGYRIDGGKVFITWGAIAQLMTVFGRLESPTDGPFMAAVIELPADGFTVNRVEEKMGMHGSPTTQVTFDGVFVPADNVLGKPGDGLHIALASLDSGRVEIGALGLGIGRGALAVAGRYLQQREQFGRPLSDFQALRFKIADHATQLEAAYQLLRAAARAIDAGSDDATRLSAMAKLFATDAGMAAATDAVGLLGGYGYLRDYPVERMMRDAKAMQIVEGTNEIQRIVIAREWFERLGQ
jgi:alkylation response protein AidB-like acyl-CoA dehydrogenase